METPEQALEHSDNEVEASDLEKIKALMDDHGDIPEHGEAVDEETGSKVSPAPEKEAPKTPEAEKPEPQGQPEFVELEDDKGQKVKVPSTLKDAFLRQADYTRKTQDVAKERAAAQQERQAIQQILKQAQQAPDFIAGLRQIDSQLAQFQGVNWQRLYQTDRQQYLELRQAANELQQTRQNMIGQANAFQQQVQALEQQEREKHLRIAYQEVLKAIPDFGPEHQKALVEVATSWGIKPEEAEQISDPRFVVGLHELKTLRAKVAEYEAKEAAAAKQVRTAPRMVKPQVAEDPAVKTERNAALDRLKKSKSDDDAVAALRHLMG